MSESSTERRFIDTGKLEFRSAENDGGEKITIGGYAAKFGVLSQNLGGFKEQIDKGAFDSVLTNDVRCLYNHDQNHVLGRTASGTLRLFVDDIGLRYEVDLPDTQIARDLATSIKRGDVSQSSFGFSIARNGDDWGVDPDSNLYIRTIKKIGRLYDVSPVTFPAYTDSTVAQRNLNGIKTNALKEKRHKDHEKRKRQITLKLI